MSNNQTAYPSSGQPVISVSVALGLLGIVTAALGFVALLGWVLGWPRLASIRADLIPMAPSTALLFLLYGVAVCLRTRMPLSRRTFGVSVAVGCFGALVALLLFTLSCLGIQWSVEHLGLNITGTVGGAPTGHMSPVTAFCFLLVSLSFLTSLSQLGGRRWRTVLGLGFASLLLGSCLIFWLAYLFGTPPLYGRTFIPPALNTVFAFVMLGLALLALAGRSAKLSRKSPGADSGPAFVFLTIFVLLVAGIVTAGSLYLWNHERHYRAEVERQLSAIAQLKVNDLKIGGVPYSIARN